MRTEREKRTASRKSERGVSLVMVLVLFLFLTALGGALASTLAKAHRSGLGHLRSIQAFYAAQAGLDWALKNNLGVSAAVPFGGCTFTVQKYYWRFTATAANDDAKRIVRGYRAIEYLPGTRAQDEDDIVEFWVQNATGYWLTVKSFKLQWTGATAYFEKVRMKRDSGDSWNKIWDFSWYGAERGKSGVKYTLSSSFSLTPGESIKLQVKNFKTSLYGGMGSGADMSQIPVKITFYSSYYSYPGFVVGTE